MAYNLQPLITILEQILDPEQTNWILDDDDKPQLQSLLQKAASLQKILENPLLSKLESSLEIQIRDAAHRAEDIIESCMVEETLLCPEPDMEQVMQELDSAMEQVEKLVVEVEGKKVWSCGSSSNSVVVEVEREVAVVVGVDGDLVQLKDRLTGTEKKLEIVSIVGMGGIGKTTLARLLYQDSLIVEHFMSCAWTTVSQDYDTKAIVSELLRCIIGKEFDEKHIKKEVGELKDILYKSLYGRRYLIVLDDMWSIQAWDDVRRCFPNTDNGSRIVITTRESDVAKHVDSQGSWHQVKLLNESRGWNLLRQTVFGEADCPDELQDIGRGIASQCGGLPLAINVIGGLLSKLEKTTVVWDRISTDVRLEITESSDERISNILSLSYDHLPNHLKPCFLYMGAFPEDHKVEPSRLIGLWIAEGFVKSNNNNNNKSMEEEAEDYLKALVVRNLVLVNGNKHDERYSMHDLLRDLCARKGEEDGFIHVAKIAADVRSSSIRRLSLEQPDGINSRAKLLSSMSLARTFISQKISYNQRMGPFLKAMRFLRVLDVLSIKFGDFPKAILQLVNIRYLALFCFSPLPTGISRLLNLQTLIFTSEWNLVPSEVLDMPELRHLKLYGEPINVKDGHTMELQNKLQTLFFVTVTDSLIKSGFFDSFPNIVELGVKFEYSTRSTLDLRHHQKLRKLTCSHMFVPSIKFPSSLRELNLYKCTVSSYLVSMMRALPNLEVLIVDYSNFKPEGKEEEIEEEWEMGEGEVFRSLQFLQLLNCKSLVRWRGDDTNFPRLCQLVIKECLKLKEIPSSIGEIPTLQLIDLYKCRRSLVASAKQIVKVQQDEYANYDLRLRTYVDK